MILANAALRKRRCMRVLSESANLVKLTRKSLYTIMETFPDEYKKLRRREAFLALGRTLIREAQQKREELAQQTADEAAPSAEPAVQNVSSAAKSSSSKRLSTIERALHNASVAKEAERETLRVAERLDELRELGSVPHRLQALEERVAAQAESMEAQRKLMEQLVLLNGGSLAGPSDNGKSPGAETPRGV